PILLVFTGLYIVLIDGTRGIVIGEGEVKLAVLFLSPESTGASQAGQFDFTHQFSVISILVDPGNGIDHIVGKKVSSPGPGVEHVLGFGDQVLPLVRSGIGGLNHHHFFVGGIAIGDQIEGGSLIVDHIGVRIGIPLYGDQVGIGIPEVLEKQFVARGGDRGRDKEVVFILGDPPAHIAVFFLRCPAEDQLVLGLGRAHFVVVQFVLVGLGRKFTAFGLVITGIEEAIVPFPGN